MSKATFHMEHEVPLVVGNSLLFAQIIELEDYAWHGTVIADGGTAKELPS